MIERISFSELESALDVLPPEVAVLLLGPAGIGKSSFTKAWAAKQQGYRYYEKNCAELVDLGDLVGRNSVVDGRTVLNPPPWFDDTQKTILFLDEINRAGANSILRGCMGLVLNHSIAELKLAEGSRVIAAANPELGTAYDVIPFDFAQSNRFFVAELTCDTDYWIDRFAVPNHVNPIVVDYIRAHKTVLHQMSDDAAATAAQEATHYRNILSTPRTWTYYAKTLDNLERKQPEGAIPNRHMVEYIGAGFIGPILASSFATFYVDSKSMKTVNIEELLCMKTVTVQRHEQLMSTFVDIINHDPTRGINLLTDIHQLLLHDGKKLLSNKRMLTIVADNYYTILKECSTELRNMVFANHIAPLGTGKDTYIAKLKSERPEIRTIFDATQFTKPVAIQPSTNNYGPYSSGAYAYSDSTKSFNITSYDSNGNVTYSSQLQNDCTRNALKLASMNSTISVESVTDDDLQALGSAWSSHS